MLTMSVRACDSGGSAEALRSIEGAIGSPFDDTLIGNAPPNVLRGLAGNDLLDGGDANGDLNGGGGNDALHGRLRSDLGFLGRHVDRRGERLDDEPVPAMGGSAPDERVTVSLSRVLRVGMAELHPNPGGAGDELGGDVGRRLG